MLDGLSRYFGYEKSSVPASVMGVAQLMGVFEIELLLRLHRLAQHGEQAVDLTTTGAISPVRTKRR